MAVAEHYGIQSEFIPGLATGFCSGVARTGGQCGALNGGVLGLGLLNGRRRPGVAVDQVYTQVQALVEQFGAEFGSLSCRELTGCHLGTPEGQQHYRETGQLARCLDYVETVTRLVLVLAERQEANTGR